MPFKSPLNYGAHHLQTTRLDVCSQFRVQPITHKERLLSRPINTSEHLPCCVHDLGLLCVCRDPHFSCWPNKDSLILIGWFPSSHLHTWYQRMAEQTQFFPPWTFCGSICPLLPSRGTLMHKGTLKGYPQGTYKFTFFKATHFKSLLNFNFCHDTCLSLMHRWKFH